MKTPDIIAALNRRHPMVEGKWANVVEYNRVDFLAVGCWQSTGFVVHGYEIKASRGDWLKELKDPRKSEWGRSIVDHWWLVCPEGVAKLEEIPDGWGYLHVDTRGTRPIVEAPPMRPELPNKYVNGAGGVVLNPEHAQREGFAMIARRLAYAEADRDALLALDTVMSIEPAMDAAALATGRWTKSQRISKADWEKRQRVVQKAQKARRGKSTYKPRATGLVGW